MIALDTNVLIALHRRDSPGHAAARAAVATADAAGAVWAIPWPCVHEFFGIATHPRIFANPSSLDEVFSAIDAWRLRPTTRFLAEDDMYWPVLADLVRAGAIAGPRIHDARIAALCLHHGVRELWTADRDFSRFPKLRTRNPLVPTGSSPVLAVEESAVAARIYGVPVRKRRAGRRNRSSPAPSSIESATNPPAEAMNRCSTATRRSDGS
jgi:hypothetical protein